MRSLTIRDVPDEPMDAQAWVARVGARKAATGGALSNEDILAYRDADRR